MEPTQSTLSKINLGRGTEPLHWSVFWLANFFGWFLYACLDLLVFFRGPLNNTRGLILHALIYASGFLITVALRYFYRRFLSGSTSLMRLTPTVLAACFVCSNLWLALTAGSLALSGLPQSDPVPHLREIFHWETYRHDVWLRFWPFFLWSILYFSIHIWLDMVQQRRAAREARQLAKQAQLELLRFQINPHFLFNSLNSLRALIKEDPDAARTMVTDLSHFLRHSLVRSGGIQIPLHEEIASVTSYLAIEKRRFEDRLQVDIEVTEEAGRVLVPCYIVHPLVENAIKHGRTGPGVLSLVVSGTLDEDCLHIEVANSGSWVESGPDGSARTQTGLANLRRLLECCYADGYKLECGEKDGWVRVSISILNPSSVEAG